ncbi:MAG: hypothetical protein P8M30_07690 [Planctomycetaceae bacterium]|nr:hypothetical protein [Planctomycetaceae bacterium]MDG2389187.1 hypothetical protein [Planctomycetaceae bacterium]
MIAMVILAALAMYWAIQDPVYEFRFDQATRQLETELLVDLKSDLERLDQTQPTLEKIRINFPLFSSSFHW